MPDTRRDFRGVRLRKSTVVRAKTIASKMDTTIWELIDRIVGPALDRLEREAPARPRSPDRPSRGRRST